MSPGFVTLFNEIYEEPLKDPHRFLLDELPIPTGLDRADLVAETAFRMAKISQEQSLSVLRDDLLVEMLPQAAEQALSMLSRYDDRGSYDRPLAQDESDEVIRLCNRYDSLYRSLANQAPVLFCPQLRGAGILDACEADISFGTCLVEVKATVRRVSGNDLRQIFVYLALDAVQHSYCWTEFVIFNPRRGTLYRADVEPLVRQISGGRQPLDVFLEMHSFLESSDLLLEQRF